MGKDTRKEIPILKINQWLEEWNLIKFSEPNKEKPEPYFYIFSMSAKELKTLTGIQRRQRKDPLKDAIDAGIQRRHEISRSLEIHEFIRYGYPWSELTDKKRESGEYDLLRKPGWLPTSIVVNILKKDDLRRGIKIDEKDLVDIISRDSSSKLLLPSSYSSEEKWNPKTWHPIEVIDGQHRLWAFEGELEEKHDSNFKNFELPVVAFHGLDISWQAYLFWVINIKPKKINPSLAFDLYPLLRSEDWFEKFEGHAVYKDIRAQELVEILWSSNESPWHEKINMLGEPGNPYITQAAWIRALRASFVKSYEGKRVTIGGIYGAPVGSNEEVLAWNRTQQAAYLILAGKHLKDALINTDETWIQFLRSMDKSTDIPELYGKHTLLNTDQGIRGYLDILNSFSYIKRDELNLKNWIYELNDLSDNDSISDAINSLSQIANIVDFLDRLSRCLMKFDWRSASAFDSKDPNKLAKLVFRGSGGYKQIRDQLLSFIKGNEKSFSKDAQKIEEMLDKDAKED